MAIEMVDLVQEAAGKKKMKRKNLITQVIMNNQMKQSKMEK